jgi:ribosome-binding protein aMBF1 (putative translation factor)
VLPPVPASVDGLIHRARTARELSQERLAASTH